MTPLNLNYHFYAHLQGMPEGDLCQLPAVEVPGPVGGSCRVTPWQLQDHQRSTPLVRSFEEVAAQLEQLPRLYFEPDGSFVWVGEEEPTSGDDDAVVDPAQHSAHRRWQVDGNLYDLHGRLLYIELKGHCPPERFDQLLSACGWPQQEVLFQLLREALYLSESDFRRWALTRSSS
jgi:hypothetical protein